MRLLFQVSLQKNYLGLDLFIESGGGTLPGAIGGCPGGG